MPKRPTRGFTPGQTLPSQARGRAKGLGMGAKKRQNNVAGKKRPARTAGKGRMR